MLTTYKTQHRRSLTFHRPPTSQAIGYRPRHRLQPRRLSGRPCPSLWRDLPPRSGREHQGGVLQVKEAATAAASWGSSLLGSALQSYGVGALINATGTLSYKGAAYLGSLIFFASSAPSVSTVRSHVYM